MASLKYFVVKPVSFTKALLLLLTAAGIAVASPASAAPRTLFVDDDLAERPNAPFQTIQAALASANAGDTIRVYPGTYAGDNSGAIAVSKSVTIQGTGPNDFQANPPAPGEYLPHQYTYVINNGQGGFDVSASTVNINRFRIVGSNAATTYPNAGINLRSGTDRTLNFNVFENNGIGLYVEGLESNLDVNNNAFYNNYRTGDTNASGGIFAPGGNLNTSTIRNNRFSTNGSFAINIGGGSTGGLVINNNTADYEGAFIVIGSTIDARITGNVATRLYSSGIYSFGGNSGMVIAQNTLQGAGITLGNGAGIRLTTGYGNMVGDSAPNINNNDISAFFYDGIGLNNVDNAVLRANTLHDNGRYGLWLQNADNSRFFTNTIAANSTVGIQVEAASVANTIGNAANGNTLSGNGTPNLDARDLSLGTKTAGTANTWKGNTGGSSATAANPGPNGGLLNN